MYLIKFFLIHKMLNKDLSYFYFESQTKKVYN